MATNLRNLVTNRLSTRNKVRLLRKRSKAKFVLHRLLGRDNANSPAALDLAPIFVIGTNRSGSSLCTLMLSKHPDIEGIFQGKETGHWIGADGHSSSGAEANHIWQSLIGPDYDITKGESVLWGLPESITNVYVGSVPEGDHRQLIDELLRARSTDKIPLVMISHNIFRIRLIKSLFPKARFVYMTRDHKSFIKSGKHKWTADKEIDILGTDGHIDYPHIGLHWLLINSIALYDLKKYAPDDHIRIKLQDLQGEESVRNSTIDRVIDFLGLDPMDSPAGVFDDAFIYTQPQHTEEIDVLTKLVNNLFDYENELT